MPGREATMELLRTITYQPAASSKMCEQALGKACGGDSKKKRPQQPPEEPQPQAQVPPAASHHHHHHSHSGPEISRIIVDPTTGKRYCRGKVLGKVMSGGRQTAGREGVLPGQTRGGKDRASQLPSLLGDLVPETTGSRGSWSPEEPSRTFQNLPAPSLAPACWTSVGLVSCIS